jgi:hypothetical protein
LETVAERIWEYVARNRGIYNEGGEGVVEGIAFILRNRLEHIERQLENSRLVNNFLVWELVEAQSRLSGLGEGIGEGGSPKSTVKRK